MQVMAGSDMIEGFQLHSPTFLGGQQLDTTDSSPPRVALARWMTAAENPFFARAAVNRLWWQFFGRGLVDPVDDLHAANAASHPELFAPLSEAFVAEEFDLKYLCRAILNSRTYGRTSRARTQGDREETLFARMSLKVLTAEQLYDSLVQVVGSPAKGAGIDARFGQRQEFCQAFASTGDPEPRRYDRGIPHVLRLMNSPQFVGRNLNSLVEQWTRSGGSTDSNLEQVFVAILARRPTSAELQYMQQQLTSADSEPAVVYRRLAWALLMSSEFSLNH